LYKNNHKFIQQNKNNAKFYKRVQSWEISLDITWIEHNSNSFSHSSCRKITMELCAYWTRITMNTCNTSPNSSNFSFFTTISSYFLISFVYVYGTFTKIIFCILWSMNTFKFKKCSIFMLITKTSFVPSEDCSDIKSRKMRKSLL
jgi:hypothetical protein